MRTGRTARPGAIRFVAASVAGGLVGVLVLGGVPARAGQASVRNACWSSFEARYRDLTLVFAGEATAGTGNNVTLSGVTASVTLPDFLPLGAYNTGALAVGQNSIPAIVYFAILGDGTTEGTQVVDTSVTAVTTITDPDGSPGTGDETATPITATATFPDTTWTRPGTDTDTVSFRQAGPNTLPQVNRPDGTKLYAPTGSLFFSAVLPGQLRVSFDCRPGMTDLGDIKGPPTPGTADPFATLGGGGGTTTTAAGATTTVAPASTTTVTPQSTTTVAAATTTVVGGSTTVPTSSGVVQVAATTTVPRTSTTTAGSRSATQTQGQSLPNTGLAVGLEALAGIVVADLGYLVWSSTRRRSLRSGRP